MCFLCSPQTPHQTMKYRIGVFFNCAQIGFWHVYKQLCCHSLTKHTFRTLHFDIHQNHIYDSDANLKISELSVWLMFVLRNLVLPLVFVYDYEKHQARMTNQHASVTLLYHRVDCEQLLLGQAPRACPY